MTTEAKKELALETVLFALLSPPKAEEERAGETLQDAFQTLLLVGTQGHSLPDGSHCRIQARDVRPRRNKSNSHPTQLQTLEHL